MQRRTFLQAGLAATVGSPLLAALRERLRALNPAAVVLLSAPGRFPSPDQLFDARGFELHDGGEWFGQAGVMLLKSPDAAGGAAEGDAAGGAAAALVARVPDGVSPAAPLLIVADTQKALEDLGRASRARCGRISGSGLASARINGLAAIFLTISGFNTPPTERPRKTSAPSITSPKVRAFVSTA